mmetsp:Transcript_26034/g.42983  ORF Transcript_26034/g.42983 Transcript_26034/m.42983 type:complete len:231 (-) Transcript_26034:212-904(-)
MVRQVTNHWLAFFTLFEAAFANQVIRIATATTTANAIAVDRVQHCLEGEPDVMAPHAFSAASIVALYALSITSFDILDASSEALRTCSRALLSFEARSICSSAVLVMLAMACVPPVMDLSMSSSLLQKAPEATARLPTSGRPSVRMRSSCPRAARLWIIAKSDSFSTLPIVACHAAAALSASTPPSVKPNAGMTATTPASSAVPPSATPAISYRHAGGTTKLPAGTSSST